MKQISRNSTILSISHNDLDGCVCQIILSHVFSDIKCINTSFYKIDQVLQGLNYDAYDYVFVTDIHPDDERNLYLSDKIILLDHHKTAMNAHSPADKKFVAENMCAAKLVYRFMTKMYPEIDLTFLNNLVYLANDYDLYTLNNPKSKLLNDVMFYKYHPVKFRREFMSGRTRFTEDEILWLRERRKEFWRRWEALQVYEMDGAPICVVEANFFLNEIAHKLMEEEGYEVVFVRNPITERASIRSKIEGLDVGRVLKERGWGGGHEKSAGMFTKNKNDFQTKTTALVEMMKKEFFS